MRNISIVIPVYNEGDNIESLFNEIIQSISSDIKYEIIFTDDASTDNSKVILSELSGKKFVKVVNHKKNLGQSHSIMSGIKKAKYDTIVTLDGDNQNVPKDIVKLLEIFLSSSELFLVGGIRVKRQDSFVKILSSKIANTIRSYLLNDDCLDTGCGLKIFSKEIFMKLPFFDGIHRFLPALFKGFGYKTFFVEVAHRPRLKGVSKYGIVIRLIKGIIDIIRVKKILKKL